MTVKVFNLSHFDTEAFVFAVKVRWEVCASNICNGCRGNTSERNQRNYGTNFVLNKIPFLFSTERLTFLSQDFTQSNTSQLEDGANGFYTLSVADFDSESNRFADTMSYNVVFILYRVRSRFRL